MQDGAGPSALEVFSIWMTILPSTGGWFPCGGCGQDARIGRRDAYPTRAHSRRGVTLAVSLGLMDAEVGAKGVFENGDMADGGDVLGGHANGGAEFFGPGEGGFAIGDEDVVQPGGG